MDFVGCCHCWLKTYRLTTYSLLVIVSRYIWNDVLLPQNLDTKLPKSLITKYYLLFDDLTTISFDRKSNCIAKNYYLPIKPLNWCISFFFPKKNFFQKFRTKISRSFRSTSPTCTSSSSGTRSSSNESRLWQTTPSEKSDQKSKSSSSKCSSTVTTKTNLIQVAKVYSKHFHSFLVGQLFSSSRLNQSSPAW